MLFYPNLLKMLEKSKRIREIGRLSGRSMGRCADSATAILPRLRGRAMGGGAVARSALHVIGVLFVTRRGEALNAPQYLPPCGLSDSHIVEPEGSAVLDALEVIEAPSHDEWTGLAIVTGPSSEAADHPGSKGE